MINLKKLPPLATLCQTLGNLPTSFILSLTYEEQILWLYNWLKDNLIPAINNNVVAIKQLQDLFILLKKYVEDYFENLDVQQEINNKLDEMAETGELQTIIENFLKLNSLVVCNTVEDMKKSKNLKVGSTVKTLGFYQINDGGGALYKVYDDTTLNVDNMFVHLLNNNLKASLIYDDIVSLLQIGGRRQTNETHYDIKKYVQAYITKNENLKNKIKLYIPYGIYYTSPILINSNQFNIYGDSNNRKKTILTSIADQDYIIKIGDYSKGCTQNILTDITFSSAIYDKDKNIKGFHKISKSALVMEYTYFLNSNYLNFENLIGSGLNINSSWELLFNVVNFQNVNAFDSGCIVFDTCNTEIFGGNANLSDCDFQYIRFEKFMGDCIQIKENSRLLNISLGTINIEPSYTDNMNITYNSTTKGLSFEKIDCLFAIYSDCVFTVDTILANNFYFRYYTINNKNYAFGDFIQFRKSNIKYEIIINTLNLWYSKIYQPNLLTNSGLWRFNPLSILTVNNIINRSNSNLKANARFAGTLQLNSPLSGTNNYNNYLTQYGNSIPCYKNVAHNSLTGQGLVTYDDFSVNPDKLVCVSNNHQTGLGKRIFSFMMNSPTLTIRAKVQEGWNVPVSVYGHKVEPSSEYIQIGHTTLEGAGIYKNYTINLNQDFIGTLCYFQKDVNNEQDFSRFDTFSN